MVDARAVSWVDSMVDSLVVWRVDQKAAHSAAVKVVKWDWTTADSSAVKNNTASAPPR